jgi:thioredoxin-like negative regulator of GroEL
MMLGLIPATILTLLSSSFVSAAADDLFQLTPANFEKEITNGHWFVEHFSPYCIHCKNFLPTWEKLVKVAGKELPEVRLAQVNCVEHGGEFSS